MKRILYIIAMVIITGLFATGAYLISTENFTSIQTISAKGEYLLHKEELVPREDVASFIVNNGMIYIYYDKAALVNVYNLDGAFVYGLQVCTFENGRGDIAVHEGKLFVESHMAIIYVFRDGQLIEMIQPSSDSQEFFSTREMFSTEKNHVHEGKTLVYLNTSNRIVIQNTQKAVISLPQKSVLGEGLLITATFSLGMLLWTVLKKHGE